MKLSELVEGDTFYPKSMAEKATPIFKVVEKCKFNSGHGSSTRLCLNLKTREYVNKSCRLEVIKNNRPS